MLAVPSGDKHQLCPVRSYVTSRSLSLLVWRASVTTPATWVLWEDETGRSLAQGRGAVHANPVTGGVSCAHMSSSLRAAVLEI